MSSNVLECPRGGECLNDKQLAAIELLLLGHKTKDVAISVGVERRTVTRWKTEELFRDELAKRRAELWCRASNRLTAMVNPALDVIESQLGDRYEHTRFRAASMVLRLADLKKISNQELEPQMDTDEHR